MNLSSHIPEIQPFEISANTSLEEINRLFTLQQSNKHLQSKTSVDDRIKKIKKLKACVLAYRQELRDGMYKDYAKPAIEVDLAEIVVLLNEINYTLRKLRSWVGKHGVGTPWFLLGANSYIQYEAKGHALVISPWNYPIHLTLMPLMHSYAAGNVTMIKPSEFTPFTTAVVKKIVHEVFDEKEAVVIEGDASISSFVTHLMFDHIYFTGSPKVGKMIMQAASTHLTSVTLELGGKSPMIIDRSADIDIAAKFAAANKLLNGGQYCIAPDYFFVHESVKDDFIKKFIEQLEYKYGKNIDELKKTDYCQIINQRQAYRIKRILDDAIEKGATVEYRSGEDADTLIGPALFTNTDKSMLIESEEVFGPISTVKTYTHIDEVINYVQQDEKPLSLYLFTKSLEIKRKVRKEISAGTMCINSAIIHYTNYNLPFGGVNHSGHGKSHGFYSFKEFSNAKAVFNQWFPWPLTLLLFPPFDVKTRKFINLFTRFFK